MASQKSSTNEPELTLDQIRPLADLPFDPDGLTEGQEEAWLEVIGKMERVYADLLEDEVELEEKNAALEDAKRFIDSVLSSMSDLLIVCDRKGKIIQVNAAVCELAGRAEEDLIDRQIEDLFVDPDGQPCSFRPGGGCESEVHIVSETGLSDLLSMRCTARKDRRGRASGLVMTARPIGELKRAYAALERAHADLQQSQQRMIYAEKMASVGRLVAGVAHELNNPISFVYSNVHALMGYAERISSYLNIVHAGADVEELQDAREKLGLDEMINDLPDLLEAVQEGAQRATNIVKGLRRMSFTGDEKASRINVDELISSAVVWARRGARRPVPISVSTTSELTVFGEESQLLQVTLNIIQNALDAMKSLDKPRLEIAARSEERQIIIEFCDDGPGIPEENLTKIFEPFFTTKEIGEGTGLGLWVSFDIVKAHGGDLSAQNRPEGGVKITLTLPSAENSSEGVEEEI